MSKKLTNYYFKNKIKIKLKLLNQKSFWTLGGTKYVLDNA